MHNLKIGIHPDQTISGSYAEKWTEFLTVRGIEPIQLNLLSSNALEQVCECDGVMWRWAHHPSHKQSAKVILYVIENYLEIPVFPSIKTAWHYDEKIAQFYLLQTLDAPLIETWVFWHEEEALTWANNVKYPVVFKLSVGAGSSNVLKVNNPDKAIRLIKRMFNKGLFPSTLNERKPNTDYLNNLGELKRLIKRIPQAYDYVIRQEYPPLRKRWWKPEFGYAYFQEFIDDNTYDTRVTIIGDRAFAFRRFNRPKGFRASGSGLIDYDLSKIDLRCIEIAFEISEKGNFQSMAFDFLSREGKPVISEISYTYLDQAVYDCEGYWCPDMSWVDGHIWPEEAQVEDFIKLIEKSCSNKKMVDK